MFRKKSEPMSEAILELIREDARNLRRTGPFYRVPEYLMKKDEGMDNEVANRIKKDVAGSVENYDRFGCNCCDPSSCCDVLGEALDEIERLTAALNALDDPR